MSRTFRRHFMTWMRACLFAFAMIAVAHDAYAQEQHVALVLGNGAYPSAQLRNPVNDANAMAAKLKDLGFDVTLGTNLKQREMGRAIIEFGKKIRPGSVAFFYFAGHGIQARGKNFLVPVDAEIESEAAVRSESVDVDAVLDQLGPARLSVIILDACRNNPFESRFRRGGSGLAQIDAPTGSILAYATAPGKTAADGTGSNGLYTAALLKAIDMPGLKIEDVFKQVRNEVIKTSANQQIPWESSSLTGEFIFRPASAQAVESEKLRRAREDQQELLKEMQKLKAELLAMKQNIAAAPLAAAATAIDPPKPAEQPRPQPATVAIATVAPPPQASTPADWSARLAAIEKVQSTLSLSKALALLLDITSDDDLTLLVAHEAYIRQLLWPTSYALGVDANGNLIWGIASNWKADRFSIETAMEFCAKKPDDTCKLVLHNGNFNVKDFLTVAKLLGPQSVAAVRSDFLKHVADAPVVTDVLSSSPMRVQKGISLKRDF